MSDAFGDVDTKQVPDSQVLFFCFCLFAGILQDPYLVFPLLLNTSPLIILPPSPFTKLKLQQITYALTRPMNQAAKDTVSFQLPLIKTTSDKSTLHSGGLDRNKTDVM